MKTVEVVFVCILSVLSAAVAAPSLLCPTSEELKPCTCKRMAYGLHIVCANFNEISDLVHAFKVLRDYRVQNVLLHGLMLKDTLPVDLFDGLEISELRVEKSKLRFPEPAFSGLDDSLHVLNVAQHSTIKSSETPFDLARLNKLTELNIKKNPLGTIKDQFLNGKIPNVVTVRLDDDEISKIESNAFANLPHLQSISIAENRITAVERSMFPRPAKALKIIDLSGNEIKSLPYDFFFDMPNLEQVVLSGNDLSTLPENTWKTVWETLDSVLLYDNGLICDDDLNWIRKLRWPRQVVGKCVAPSEVVGKSLEEVYKT